MAARLAPIDNEVDAIASLVKRVERIEDSLSERLLPPGYVVLQAGNNLVIRRRDGATSTLVFS